MRVTRQFFSRGITHPSKGDVLPDVLSLVLCIYFLKCVQFFQKYPQYLKSQTLQEPIGMQVCTLAISEASRLLNAPLLGSSIYGIHSIYDLSSTRSRDVMQTGPHLQDTVSCEIFFCLEYNPEALISKYEKIFFCEISEKLLHAYVSVHTNQANLAKTLIFVDFH